MASQAINISVPGSPQKLLTLPGQLKALEKRVNKHISQINFANFNQDTHNALLNDVVQLSRSYTPKKGGISLTSARTKDQNSQDIAKINELKVRLLNLESQVKTKLEQERKTKLEEAQKQKLESWCKAITAELFSELNDIKQLEADSKEQREAEIKLDHETDRNTKHNDSAIKGEAETKESEEEAKKKVEASLDSPQVKYIQPDDKMKAHWKAVWLHKNSHVTFETDKERATKVESVATKRIAFHTTLVSNWQKEFDTKPVDSEEPEIIDVEQKISAENANSKANLKPLLATDKTVIKTSKKVMRYGDDLTMFDALRFGWPTTQEEDEEESNTKNIITEIMQNTFILEVLAKLLHDFDDLIEDQFVLKETLSEEIIPVSELHIYYNSQSCKFSHLEDVRYRVFDKPNDKFLIKFYRIKEINSEFAIRLFTKVLKRFCQENPKFESLLLSNQLEFLPDQKDLDYMFETMLGRPVKVQKDGDHFGKDSEIPKHLGVTEKVIDNKIKIHQGYNILGIALNRVRDEYEREYDGLGKRIQEILDSMSQKDLTAAGLEELEKEYKSLLRIEHRLGVYFEKEDNDSEEF